ncbi:RHS repeat domain-containing protein, partial [Tahibacter harae]
AGNRTSVVTGTRTINFGFDTLNRLSSVSEVASAALGQSGAAKVTTYGYDGVGNRDHVIHNNGTRVDYRYDRMNRLTKLVHSKGAAVLLALGYTLNPDGTRAQIAEQVQQRDAQGQYVVDGQGQPVLDATRTTSYDYDATKRLVEEAVTSATPGYDRLTTWTYDSVGNRLNQLMTIPGGSLPGGATVPASTTTTSYRYDANDRLLDETAVSNGMTRLTTHRYDLNGSLVETIAPDATTRYRYDGRNKLAQVERQVGSVLDITQYTYTHDGIRRSQIQKAGTLDAKEVRYLIDPSQAYAQVIEERVGAPLAPGANVSGLSLKAAYTYGDDLLGQYALRDMQGNVLPNVGAPSGTPNPVAVASTFHYDGLGSTRLLTDAAGSPVDRYAYHAFGERDEWTSELGAGQNAATDYQYTGEQFDPNLGFYYLRARYMNLGNGRFARQDDFAGYETRPVSVHKYLYADLDPANRADPSGRMSLSEMSSAQNIQSVLSTNAVRGATRQSAKFLRKVKMYDVYAYVSWPLHFYMCAEKIGFRNGYRYDVGNAFGWGSSSATLNPFGVIPGGVIKVDYVITRNYLKGRKKKVASLTFAQWYLWHRTVVGAETTVCEISYPYSVGPNGADCLSWTIWASLEAVGFSKLPL